MTRKPPAIVSRIIDASASIAADSPASIDYQHAVLCQVGMPRKATAGDTFERTSGNASLLITAGQLWDGRHWMKQPLPYGVQPRLALVHVSSEAIRTRSPIVDVGHSTRDFLLRLGAQVDGRTYARFQKQMRALAACEMRLGVGMTTTKFQPIDTFEAWLATDKQAALWPGTLQLSARFFETLSEFAVPLDARALAALKHSALALDTYAWLAHRLHRVNKAGGVMLSWSNLRDQFGQEYANPKDFKREFRQALRAALAVYPAARVEAVMGGVLLKPSRPPVAKTAIAVSRKPLG